MKCEYTNDFICEAFFAVDNFCIIFDNFLKQKQLNKFRKERKDALCRSEIITILICYQHSGYKNFEYFYESEFEGMIKVFFPNAPCYPRFIARLHCVFLHMYAFTHFQCLLNPRTGKAYIDSKKLPVCHNRRIKANKVFKGIASRGKSSTGWFYGLKIHLIINHLGDILDFELTAGNVADNNPELLRKLTKNVSGKLFGDKGYLTKIFEELYENGIHLITNVRRNMKNQLIDFNDKLWLLKRGTIESVNDILMTVFDIEHTRHRSPVNAIIHIFSALASYGFYKDKPTAILNKILELRA